MPSLRITIPSKQHTSMAMDAVGTIFLDQFNESDFISTISEYPAGTTSSTLRFVASPRTDSSGAQATFTALAVDPKDTLYVPTTFGPTQGSSLEMYFYPTGGNRPNASASVDDNGGLQGGVAVDSAGNRYCGDILDYTFGPYFGTNCTILSSVPQSNGVPFQYDTQGNAPGALAVDGN